MRIKRGIVWWFALGLSEEEAAQFSYPVLAQSGGLRDESDALCTCSIKPLATQHLARFSLLLDLAQTVQAIANLTVELREKENGLLVRDSEIPLDGYGEPASLSHVLEPVSHEIKLDREWRSLARLAVSLGHHLFSWVGSKGVSQEYGPIGQAIRHGWLQPAVKSYHIISLNGALPVSHQGIVNGPVRSAMAVAM